MMKMKGKVHKSIEINIVKHNILREKIYSLYKKVKSNF